MRLIDADRLIEENWNTPYFDNRDRDDVVFDLIENQPTIEERPVAQWKDNHCTHCGAGVPVECIDDFYGEESKPAYCPDCGAIMIKEEK